MRYFLALFILASVGIVMVAGFQGDKSRKPPIEVFPDMDRQPKLRPQTDTEFMGWRDGLSSRKPVEGTVARDAVFIEDAFSTGFEPGTTNYVTVSPVAVTDAVMKRGQQRFNIYCIPCHGRVGNGQGITTKLGMAGVVNLHDARVVGMPDGQIFYTITHGKGLMGAYGSNIDPADRWAVVAYVRALQRSQLATMEDVPEFARKDLK